MPTRYITTARQAFPPQPEEAKNSTTRIEENRLTKEDWRGG